MQRVLTRLNNIQFSFRCDESENQKRRKRRRA
jgi:hypothetical protein